MAKFLTKGERTSQAILEAAYSLFVEQGFHATSMRQIAQRAGIALSGIYNHFGSKEQIFDQILLEKHPYHQVLEILQSTSGDTIDAFMLNAAHTIVAELGRHPDFFKLVFIELTEFRGVHAPRLYRTILPQFIPLVERFQSTQSQLRNLPPPTILLSFIGMLFAYYLTSSVISLDSPVIPEPGNMEQFMEIFLHGILKPEAP
jgi:AcrR family transcriptional regulator